MRNVVAKRVVTPKYVLPDEVNIADIDVVTDPAAEVLDNVKKKIRRRVSMGAQLALEDGVEKKVIIKWIEKELEEEKACLSIPFIILLLTLFVVMVNSHLSQSEVRGVEQAITHMLSTSLAFGFSTGDTVVGHKNVHDVHTVADMYSWFDEGLVPAIMVEDFQVSETIRSSVLAGTKIQLKDFPEPSPANGDFLQYNTIIGGIRFQQKVAEKSECKLPENFLSYFTNPCYESNLYLQPPENFHWLPLSSLESDRAEYFLLSDPASTWLERLRDMEIGCSHRQVTGGNCLCDVCGDYPWVDPSTLKVEATFVALNRELGAWSLININFFMNRGGGVRNKVHVESQWVDPYSRGWQLLAQEICWFVMNMIILVQEVMEIYHDTKLSGGWRSFFGVFVKYYKDPWNFIDSVTILLTFCLLGMWTSHIGRSALILENFPDDYANLSTKSDLESFFIAIQEIFVLELYVRILFSLYAFVIMLRLFKGYAAQPRLALVTRTLQRAGLDLVHFLFVFVTIFAAFGAAGLSMFGREMDEFSTFALSINTLYRILLGDFIWNKMAVVGTAPAALFFWLYTIIVVLLMLNMLLAVILETYSHVKQEVGNAETLWSQVAETFGRWREKRQGKRVGLQLVLDCLINANFSPDDIATSVSVYRRRTLALQTAHKVTLLGLMELVPGLQVHEASEILTASLSDELWKRKHAPASSGREMTSLDDVVHALTQHQAALSLNSTLALKSIHADVASLRDELQALRVHRVANLLSSSKPSYDQKTGDSECLTVNDRIELLERSFDSMIGRLNTVDRLPKEVRDLMSPIQVQGQEPIPDGGCVSLMFSGCKPKTSADIITQHV